MILDEFFQADIKTRCSTLKTQADLLQTELLLLAACQEAGTENDVQGATQGVQTALRLIDDNLTVLRGYCS